MKKVPREDRYNRNKNRIEEVNSNTGKVLRVVHKFNKDDSWRDKELFWKTWDKCQIEERKKEKN